MAKVKYSNPVDSLSGKLSARQSNGRVYVSRRKCFGYDAKGRPIYGPNEHFVYTIHEGEWPQAIVDNRQLFRQAQILAREELRDSERLAYWQPLFDKQFRHPKQGEKHYSTILGFVVAQILAELKSAKQAEEAAKQAEESETTATKSEE